ncbi:MAG: universal stress protein [Gammaproteobacteria bacterium]|nr:universal stress protein [Gammaproteobacteria bacterium]MCW5583928.1 universal stress protein [Gammaproteobacteria bacterium]
MKHILVAYDASEQAEKAFDFAIEMADKYKAALTVLAIAPTVNISEETETEDLLKSSLNYYNDSFSHLQRKAGQHYPSVKIDFKIVDGTPAEEIVKNAEALGVDHIVMGHRGLSTFKRWLLGSVAKQVMIYAHCAITIIR